MISNAKIPVSPCKKKERIQIKLFIKQIRENTPLETLIFN